MIYLLGDFHFPDAASLEATRTLELAPGAYADWEAGLSPFSGNAYPAPLTLIVPYERKQGFTMGVRYEGTTLRLRAALPDKRFGVASSLVILAREAAKRGATGQLHVLQSGRGVGHVLVLAHGDAPWLPLGKEALRAALASPEVAALDACVAAKTQPPNDEGADAAPKTRAPASPPRAQPGRVELGLRDISELAHAPLDGPPGPRAAGIPEVVAQAEDEAIRRLGELDAAHLLAAAKRLPEVLQVYRREGRRGEPLPVSVAFSSAEELLTALRAAPREPSPTWGQSLRGLAFVLLGEAGDSQAEALAREAFFSSAPDVYRSRAAWGLRGCLAADVLDAFLAVVTGRARASTEVREGVALALTVLAHPETGARALAALGVLLAEKPDHYATFAADLARVVGEKRHLPGLAVLLSLWRGRDAHLRLAAGEALLALGAPEGLQALAEKTRSTDQAIQALALTALVLQDPIGAHEVFAVSFGKNFEKNHTAYLTTLECLAAVTRAASRSPSIGDAIRADDRWFRSAEALLSTLAADDAAEFLGHLGAPGAAAAIVAHLAHLLPERAAAALLACGDRSVVPALREATARMNKTDTKAFAPVFAALGGEEGSR